MASEGHSVQASCRVLDVSESGYYEWRGQGPSARSVRQVWLTEQIMQIHSTFRGVYGARRIHAELTLGQQVKGRSRIGGVSDESRRYQRVTGEQAAEAVASDPDGARSGGPEVRP